MGTTGATAPTSRLRAISPVELLEIVEFDRDWRCGRECPPDGAIAPRPAFPPAGPALRRIRASDHMPPLEKTRAFIHRARRGNGAIETQQSSRKRCRVKRFLNVVTFHWIVRRRCGTIGCLD